MTIFLWRQVCRHHFSRQSNLIYSVFDKHYLEKNPSLNTSLFQPPRKSFRMEGIIPGIAQHHHSDTEQHQADDDNSDDVSIPEAVRQFERQVKKSRAEARVACPISVDRLRVIYNDDFIVVIDKPSGTLSVPGLRGNPSMAQLVFDAYGCESGRVDKMIVHRLDMDTSGIVIYAKTETALKRLNVLFRDHKVQKSYEALVCGHMGDNSNEGEINLPIQRDHNFPPFMRIATKESEEEAALLVEQLQHSGYKKLLRKSPKQCQTKFCVMSRELFHGKEPVTRLTLTPVTGR